jgi:virginiamycin B lyase
LPSDETTGPVPSGPRDAAAFRASVLRRAARIERRRRVTRLGGWALGVTAVALSTLALVERAPASSKAALPAAAPSDRIAVRSFPVTDGVPWAATTGSDGAVWVTGQPLAPGGAAFVERITPAGDVTRFPLPTGSDPAAITAGSDGALWFTDPGLGSLGRITTSGVVTEHRLPHTPGDSITMTADGALWVPEPAAGAVAKVSESGAVSQVVLAAGRRPESVATGPDGSVWVGEGGGPYLARIAATGAVVDWPLPDPAERVVALADGIGPALWYSATSPTGTRLGHVSTGGTLIEEALGEAEAPPAMTLASDGRLWFSGPVGTMVALGVSGMNSRVLSQPVTGESLTSGSDGELWVVDRAARTVDRLAIA